MRHAWYYAEEVSAGDSEQGGQSGNQTGLVNFSISSSSPNMMAQCQPIDLLPLSTPSLQSNPEQDTQVPAQHVQLVLQL